MKQQADTPAAELTCLIAQANVYDPNLSKDSGQVADSDLSAEGTI